MPATARPAARQRGRPRNPPNPQISSRIRTLRLARRMTQAELAGQDFTKGFISLLETNRTGLSVRAATIISNRLGISVDDLLRPAKSGAEGRAQLGLTQAEALFASGRHEDALRQTDAIKGTTGVLRGRQLRLRGRAMIQTDRSPEAVALLDEALRLFRAGGEKALAARTMFDLAQASSKVGAYGEAINWALQCEHAINAGEVVDATLELNVLALLVSHFVTLGDLTSADLRIERAKRLAEDIADPWAVGGLYFDLAVARQREGDPEAALNFSLKALAAYEQMGIPAHLGNAWNTLAGVYVARRQFARAAEALGKAERIAEETSDGRLAAYVLQTWAELTLAQGKHEDAVRLAQASIDHAEAPERCRALSLLVKAEALAKTSASLRQVNDAFAEAVEALMPHGRNLRARAHQAHFEALAARGKPKEAETAARAAFEALKSALV